MTEKQYTQYRRLIAYVQELVRQHNKVERLVEELEAMVNKPTAVEPTSR